MHGVRRAVERGLGCMWMNREAFQAHAGEPDAQVTMSIFLKAATWVQTVYYTKALAEPVIQFLTADP
jgi:hypothetical protein